MVGEWLEKHTLNVQRHRPTEAFAPWRWTPGVRRSQSDKVFGARKGRKHAVSTAEELLAGARRLLGFDLRQKLLQAFDAKGREGGYRNVVVDIADVEAAVFRLHVEGDFFQQGFVFVEHLCHLGDGEDLARRRHVQAALAMARRSAQFQGSSSSTRLAGCSAMRARMSASQACGSTSFSLAVTMRP